MRKLFLLNPLLQLNKLFLKNMSTKNQNEESNPNIKIENKNSSLNEFVKRNIASSKDIEEFDKYIESGIKDDEIEKNLAKIYKYEDGNDVDITKLEKKQGLGVFGLFFLLLFILILLVGATWSYYIYLYPKDSQITQEVDMTIDGPKEIIAGQDFVYKINYANPTDIEIRNVEITLIPPDNFILLDSNPPIEDSRTIWKIKKINSLSSGNIKIKGKLIGKQQEKSIALADMSWTPVNTNAEFRKNRALETIINKTGLNFNFTIPSNVLVGDIANIFIKYTPDNDNYLKNIRFKIDQIENIEFESVKLKDEDETNIIEKIKKGTWQINEIDNNEHIIEIQFKVIKKINEIEKIKFHFEYAGDDDAYYSFLEKTIDFNVIKNDLNLSLILNGSTIDQGVNFGQTLNYSIAFSNKGVNNLGNVAIMAVLDSDIIDWSSIKASNNGVIKSNTITWSHREDPQLKTLKGGDDGLMDFSANVLPFNKIKGENINYKISSYAQFGIGKLGDSGTTTKLSIDETRSNTIVARVNSNLKLNETVRYFNDDNIAVGLGPLPPRVGESTKYRVYWEATNNLHKLSNIIVKTTLPKYVYWVSNLNPTIGTLNYNNSTHQVVWNIGNLEINELIGNVSFDIKIDPIEDDIGKVLVLLSNTIISAFDEDTKAKINFTGQANTTRLENDEIGISDGIVRKSED